MNAGLYTRLDYFQHDLFSMFSRARDLSMLDSRVYSDSVTLQRAYIAARNSVCAGGKILKSTALNFSMQDLEAS